jgi:hypothetical protein
MVQERFQGDIRTNEICPWCGKGAVLNRCYNMRFGPVVRFATCDNPDCNVEWFAEETNRYWNIIDNLAKNGLLTINDELKERRESIRTGDGKRFNGLKPDSLSEEIRR